MVRRLMGEHPFLTLGTLATGAIMMTSCSKDQTIIDSLDRCLSQTHSEDVCKVAIEDAKKDHVATAPRFRNMPACEMEYGARACEMLPTNHANNPSGNDVFSPKLVGFYLPSGIYSLATYHAYRKRTEEEQQTPPGTSTSGGGYSSFGRTIYRNKNGENVVPDLEARAKAKQSGLRDVISMAPYDSRAFNPRTETSSRSGFGSGHSAGSGSHFRLGG